MLIYVILCYVIVFFSGIKQKIKNMRSIAEQDLTKYALASYTKMQILLSFNKRVES